MRPIVVVKTHAATGQRSPAGNIKSAVWDTSPLHNSSTSHTTREEIDAGKLSTISVGYACFHPDWDSTSGH